MDKLKKCSSCGEQYKNDPMKKSLDYNSLKENEHSPDVNNSASQENNESDDNIWSLLWKFLHYYEELSPSKAYLLLGGEFVLGIGFVLLGWAMSSNSGYRGNSTGAFGFLIGGVFLFYSLYAIIKHTTRQIILKKEPNAKEIKIRGIAFLAELIMGGFIFLIGNSISGDRDTADIIRIMAIGMIAVAVLSILKFLIKQSSVKK